MAHHEMAGIELNDTAVPVAPVKAKRKILEINICKPKPKYGLKLAAFFLVYNDPKAHVNVEISESAIPNLKSGCIKSARWS